MNYNNWQKQNMVLVDTVVIRVVDVIEYDETKVKTVFECLSKTGKTNTCIIWQHFNLKAGDKLTMKGVWKDRVFVAYDIMIKGNIKELGNETREDDLIS